MILEAFEKMLGWPPPAWVRKVETATIMGVFAKAFEVKGRVRRATLHVTGVGFYEARMDGEKIGDKVFFLSRGGVAITETEKQQLRDAGII